MSPAPNHADHSTPTAETRGKTRYRRAAVIALPLAAGLTLAACSTSGSQASGSGASVEGTAVSLVTDDCPADATEPLGDGEDIVIGTSLAMSGPAASAAVSLAGVNAYFDKINDDGGIDGHHIRFLAKDDALETARAVSNVKSLIEQEHVFATIMQLGTPQSQATRDIYERNCVPQLYVSSGAPDFYDPSEHQWSTSGFLPYGAWASATADFLGQEFPDGPKVAELEWTSDVGKASSTAFANAADGTDIDIVSEAEHGSNAVSLSNQVNELLARSPDAIVASTGGSFCTQLVSEARSSGFTGPIIMPLACRDTTQFFEPLGDAATNVQSVRSELDPASSANADDSDVQEYLADMARYQPDADARSTYVANGYSDAALLVEQLRKAADSDDGLTRTALMDAVWSTDAEIPMNFEGHNTVINGESPYPIGYGKVMSWDADTHAWTDTGVDVSAGQN